jgi:hypothetical protein
MSRIIGNYVNKIGRKKTYNSIIAFISDSFYLYKGSQIKVHASKKVITCLFRKYTKNKYMFKCKLLRW